MELNTKIKNKVSNREDCVSLCSAGESVHLYNPLEKQFVTSLAMYGKFIKRII